MRKRIVEVLILACFLTFLLLYSRTIEYQSKTERKAYNIKETELPDEIVVYVEHDTLYDLQEEIRNEVMYGEIELLAQLVEAEAGNQDETGKRYVADVPLNRVDDDDFPDKLEDVIFQPNHFSCITDGNFEKAGWHISDESFKVALEEYTGERLNDEILYFRTDRYSDYGTPAFQYADHYFSK